ncbi:MAG: hypothetical protein AAGA43_13470 [Bacteroidota bacterium]
MIRANLDFNHYYPFYTLTSFGKKKYSYFEKIHVHLSDTKRLKFELNYRSGKLNEIEYKKNSDDKINLYDKELKYLSYTEFAIKMKTFENFLIRGLRSLSNETAFRKVMVFGSNYKFSSEWEIEFDYSQITLKKDQFEHSIQDGKLVKPKRESNGDGDLAKLVVFFETIDEYTKFNTIEQNEFYKDLDSTMGDYLPYLEAPKFLRKKQYEL